MEKVIDVSTGQVKVGGEGVILRSTAIGSCVVVAAYNSSKKIGAMVHIMLPGRAPEKTSDRTRYGTDAIDEMIRRMARLGVSTEDIEACLVGGANVLKKEDDTICKDNIESTTQLLEQKHIPVRAVVLGGTKRKGIFLDVGAGSVFYTEGDEEEKPLWKSTRGSV